MNRTITVIPARYAATRLPGKPLADIHGRTMIEWVWRRVVDAGVAKGNTFIATDDDRVRTAVAKFESTPVIPTFAKMAVRPANSAESNDQ